MSWQDRPYNQEESSIFSAQQGGGGPSFGGGFADRLRGASVVTFLLIANFVIFVLDGALTGSSRADALAPWHWLAFTEQDAVGGLQIWRFVTYSFIHADFFHILFNMIALFFFGPLMEQWWGSRRFLAFYLLCAVAGAVMMMLLAHVPGLLGPHASQAMLVGASGSIFGILVGAAMKFPHMRVMLLIPPIPMSMRTIALIFLGIAVLTILAGGQNAGGQAAHLGGAVLGFVLIRYPFLLDWADAFSPSGLQNQFSDRQQQRMRKRKQDMEQEVDRILDKVKREGLHSLSRREKQTLRQATDQKNKP